MTHMEFVAKRMKELRLQRELTAQDLCLELGRDMSYVSKVEDMTLIPSQRVIQDYCDYFGISLPEFYGTFPPEVPDKRIVEVIDVMKNNAEDVKDTIYLLAQKLDKRKD